MRQSWASTMVIGHRKELIKDLPALRSIRHHLVASGPLNVNRHDERQSDTMRSVARWQVLTEAGLLLLALLLALVALGVSVPFFRTLLGLATALLAAGVLWRALHLLRGEEVSGVEGGKGRAIALQDGQEVAEGRDAT